MFPCLGRGMCLRSGACRCSDGYLGQQCQMACPGVSERVLQTRSLSRLVARREANVDLSCRAARSVAAPLMSYRRLLACSLTITVTFFLHSGRSRVRQ